MRFNFFNPLLRLHAPAEESGGGGGGNPPNDGTPPGDGAPPDGGTPPDKPVSLIGEDLSFREGWQSVLPEDLQPVAAKFRNLPDFVKSYKHAEQTMSGKLQGYVKAPAADAPPEERNAFLKSIGIATPEKPEDYALKPEDTSPLAAVFNEGRAKNAQELFHKAGITAEQGKVLFGALLEADAAEKAEQERQGTEFFATRTKELTSMFGQNLEGAVTKAKQMLATIDPTVDLAELDIMPASMVAGLARLADRLAPDMLANEAQIGNKLSGAAQANDIIHNKNNPDYEAFHTASHVNHGAVKAKVLALFDKP